MQRRNWVALLLGLIILLFSGSARAHVTVWPKESKTGAFEKYTVRVPVEKDVNTIKVRLIFPEGVTVETVHPVPGWGYAFEKGGNGKNAAIVWTATNGGIKPGEFQEFYFLGKNSDEPASLSWKADQTYADGTVVQWIEGKDGNHPASVTVVTGDSTSAGENSHNHGSTTAVASQTSSHDEWGIGTVISIVVSGIAILLSICALFRRQKIKIIK